MFSGFHYISVYLPILILEKLKLEMKDEINT